MSTGYFVYAEDLTLIADAIRAKTETTNLLSFPEGFISGIDAIQVPPENPLPEFTYSSTNYQVIDDGNGDWRIKFNATGTFRVTSQVTVDIFVVGGGGGGSSRWAGVNSSTELDQGRGVDGGDGVGNSGYAGKGQGTTTREFGETTGTLYSTGGDYYRSIANIVAVKANTGDGGANNGTAGKGASGIVVIRNARGGNPMRYALVENGIVSNIIWLYSGNDYEFPNAIHVGELPVSIGDEIY